MDFFYYFEMLSFLSPNNTSEKKEFPPVKYHLCWICTSNKNKALKTINLFFSHFLEFTLEQVLKSFSGRNNSLKPPVFGFCDSLPFGLEESRE